MKFFISFCRNIFISSASTLGQQHRISTAFSRISVGCTAAGVGHRRNGVMYLIALIAIPSLSKQSFMVPFNLWKTQKAEEEALELQRFHSISAKNQEAEKETLELQRFHSEFHSISEETDAEEEALQILCLPCGPLLPTIWPWTAQQLERFSSWPWSQVQCTRSAGLKMGCLAPDITLLISQLCCVTKAKNKIQFRMTYVCNSHVKLVC